MDRIFFLFDTDTPPEEIARVIQDGAADKIQSSPTTRSRTTQNRTCATKRSVRRGEETEPWPMRSTRWVSGE